RRKVGHRRGDGTPQEREARTRADRNPVRRSLMNRLHRWYCRSSQWKQVLENKVLPWSLGGVDLGDEVLEVGPGPGLTTDWLRRQTKTITSIEVDSELADTLNRRLAGTNASVQCGDATAMPFGDRTF